MADTQGRLDGIIQPGKKSGPNHKTIDHGLDGVFAPLVQGFEGVALDDFAVDSDSSPARAACFGEEFAVLTFAVHQYGRKQNQSTPLFLL